MFLVYFTNLWIKSFFLILVHDFHMKFYIQFYSIINYQSFNSINTSFKCWKFSHFFYLLFNSIWNFFFCPKWNNWILGYQADFTEKLKILVCYVIWWSFIALIWLDRCDTTTRHSRIRYHTYALTILRATSGWKFDNQLIYANLSFVCLLLCRLKLFNLHLSVCAELFYLHLRIIETFFCMSRKNTKKNISNSKKGKAKKI